MHLKGVKRGKRDFCGKICQRQTKQYTSSSRVWKWLLVMCLFIVAFQGHENVKLCWECRVMLRKLQNFQNQLKTAQHVLFQMMYQNNVSLFCSATSVWTDACSVTCFKFYLLSGLKHPSPVKTINHCQKWIWLRSPPFKLFTTYQFSQSGPIITCPTLSKPKSK